MLCPLQLSSYSPKRCSVTTCRNYFCRVTLDPFGGGKSAPLDELLFTGAHLLSRCSCCGDSFDPCVQPCALFWNVSSMAGGSAVCVIQLFIQWPQGKELYRAHKISGGEEVSEICWFLVAGGRCWGSAAAFVGLPCLWNSWTQYVSCWSPQEVSIMHDITSVGLPAWFNGRQLF